jgi:hypothetical protein
MGYGGTVIIPRSPHGEIIKNIVTNMKRTEESSNILTGTTAFRGNPSQITFCPQKAMIWT